MENSYEMTGFQSACAEFAEDRLSLDKRYLTNKPSLFFVEVASDARHVEIRKGDKLLIDRSLTPRDGQLCLFVINNQFQLKKFSPKMLEGQDPEVGDFIWGVVTTWIRELEAPRG